MINKGVYTFYTDRGSNFKQGFRNNEAFISFFKDSIVASKKQFKQVKIYTDKEGHAFLSGHGIEDELLVPFDFYPFDWDKRYWNFPKIMVYNDQTEPFLHMDLDSKLTKPIKKELLQGQVLSEMLRSAQLMANQRMNIPQKYWNAYDPVIPCSGLIGGTNLDVFKELYQVAVSVVSPELNDIPYEIHFWNLVTIEEVLMKILCNERGIVVSELEKDSFIHLQGQKKLSV